MYGHAERVIHQACFSTSSKIMMTLHEPSIFSSPWYTVKWHCVKSDALDLNLNLLLTFIKRGLRNSEYMVPSGCYHGVQQNPMY